MARRAGVVVLVVVGLLGAAWAAQPHPDRQVFSCQSTEASDGDAAPEQSGPQGWFQGVWDECRCRDKTGKIVSPSLFVLPRCFSKNLLFPCDHNGSAPVGFVILAVFFAVLMRQTALGYRKNLRLSFALFLTLFLGMTMFGFSALLGVSTSTLGVLGVSTLGVEFTMILLVSAFSGGVLAFWTKYLLDLLAVAAGASLLAILTDLTDLQSIRTPLIVVAGIAGGLWLHWWRDHRQKPQASASGQGQPAAHQDGGRQGVEGKSSVKGKSKGKGND